MQTNAQAKVAGSPIQSEALNSNQFRVAAVPPASALLIGDAAVFNVASGFFATQAKCTDRGSPLNEGKLDGSTVTCPWYGTSTTCARVQCYEARPRSGSRRTA
jgi:nitrite reductase/ring-hydroxylating ferredoxin subunit